MTNATTQTKIAKARQIILAMQFLGIAEINFAALKNQFNGLDGLYEEMASRLGA